MYYVPDGTKQCGYYECKKCGNRFLSLQTMNRIPCPDCASEIDYEIGPDETLVDETDKTQNRSGDRDGTDNGKKE